MLNPRIQTGEDMQTLLGIYTVLIKYRSVYIYQLVPIFYFTWIFGRLMYYKCKYNKKIFLKDILTLITLIVLVFDYGHYLYLFVAGTGQLLSLPEFLIKYSLGTLLWIWMFIYHYEVYVRNNLLKEHSPKERKKAIFAYTLSVILILFLIVVLQQE